MQHLESQRNSIVFKELSSGAPGKKACDFVESKYNKNYANTWFMYVTVCISYLYIIHLFFILKQINFTFLRNQICIYRYINLL